MRGAGSDGGPPALGSCLYPVADMHQRCSAQARLWVAKQCALACPNTPSQGSMIPMDLALDYKAPLLRWVALLTPWGRGLEVGYLQLTPWITDMWPPKVEVCVSLSALEVERLTGDPRPRIVGILSIRLVHHLDCQFWYSFLYISLLL